MQIEKKELGVNLFHGFHIGRKQHFLRDQVPFVDPQNNDMRYHYGLSFQYTFRGMQPRYTNHLTVENQLRFGIHMTPKMDFRILTPYADSTIYKTNALQFLELGFMRFHPLGRVCLGYGINIGYGHRLVSWRIYRTSDQFLLADDPKWHEPLFTVSPAVEASIKITKQVFIPVNIQWTFLEDINAWKETPTNNFGDAWRKFTKDCGVSWPLFLTGITYQFHLEQDKTFKKHKAFKR